MERRNLAIVLALVGSAVGLVLFLLPKTPTAIVGSLLALFALLFYPVIYLTTSRTGLAVKESRSQIIIAEGILLILVAVFGIYVWPQELQQIGVASTTPDREAGPATGLSESSDNPLPQLLPSRDAPELDSTNATPKPSVTIQQRSGAPNSPNTAVIGDNNQVTVNPDPAAPVITFFYDGNQRISRPGRITDNPDNPAARAFPRLQSSYDNQDWSLLLSLCDDAILETPQWLTPYLYKALANANLGHIAESVELLDYVKKEAAGNRDYVLLIKQANELREKIREVSGR